jgi:hypothetical protein
VTGFTAGPKIEFERIPCRNQEEEGNLIGTKAINFTIVLHGKAVIEQETMIALLAVGIVDLGPCRDGLQTVRRSNKEMESTKKHTKNSERGILGKKEHLILHFLQNLV